MKCDDQDRSTGEAGTTITPRAPQSLVRLLLPALALVFITAVVQGPSIIVPFWTDDDSDLIRQAGLIKAKMAEGDLLAPFAHEPNSGRYWPGAWLHIILRLTLFDKQPVLWHLWQIGLYVAAGLCLMAAARRLTGSHWPGVAAHLLLLSTGGTEVTSNWENFYITNTFEPLLYALWSLSALCLGLQVSLPPGIRSKLLAGAGLLLACWSIITKETAFAVVLMALFPVLVLVWWKPDYAGGRRDFRRLAIPLATILVFAVVWGVRVFSVLPREAGYGGTASLVKSPALWGKSLAVYWGMWTGSCHTLIALALGHFLLRVTSRRGAFARRDMWMAVLAWASFSHLFSLSFWPQQFMRLSQPAYASALLFTCCEIAIFLNGMMAPRETAEGSPNRKMAALRIALTTLVLLFVFFGKRFVPRPAFDTCLDWVYLAWLLVTSAGLWFLYRGCNTGRWPLRYASGILLLSFSMTALLAAITASSYPVNFRSSIGIRQKAARWVALNAPPNAKVSWLTSQGWNGFAWAMDLHVKEFFRRKDLRQGPHTWVRTQGALQAGDLIVIYQPGGPDAPAGEGTLARYNVEENGYVAPVEDLAGLRRLLVDGLLIPSRIPRKALECRYVSATISIFQIQSPTWKFAPDFESAYIW